MLNIALDSFSLQDLLQPELLADPYPVFRQLRSEDPIHEDPTGQGWIVSRYDDVALVLSVRRFSAERVLAKSGGNAPVNRVQDALARQMLFLDPPDHTRLRALFTKAFTPYRIVDTAEAAGGHIDFIHDFAVPLPVAVIAQMLGVPLADRDRLRVWSIAFGKLISGRILSSAESVEAQQGILAFIQYFGELIEQRRQHPVNDMLSDLIAVEEMGDRLSPEELIVNLILLLAAGHGTTTHLLGNGLLALSQNPREWQLLTLNFLSQPRRSMNSFALRDRCRPPYAKLFLWPWNSHVPGSGAGPAGSTSGVQRTCPPISQSEHREQDAKADT